MYVQLAAYQTETEASPTHSSCSPMLAQACLQ